MSEEYADVEQDITQRLLASVDAMQDEGGAHPVPSPSGIYNCRRQQYYGGTGAEVTDRIPPQSVKRLESGHAAEPFWHRAFAKAGFIVMTLAGGSRIRIGEDMTGEFDGFLMDPVANKRYGLELKDLGVWTYIRMVQEGVRSADPGYYAQVQQYLGGLGLEAMVFLAGQADPSAITWVWQKIKKLEGEPPAFHLEVLPFDKFEYDKALERAAEVKGFIDREELPMRDFDPLFKKNDSDKNFPCGTDERAYCRFRQRCLVDG